MALLAAPRLLVRCGGDLLRMGKLTSRLRWAAQLALIAAAAAVPAEAQADAPAPCDPVPVAQVFLPWADPAWYSLVPDGGLEQGGAGWTMRAGAAVVGGNEPYYVRAPSDARSLALPNGASAGTPPVCVGPGHPTLRFFVRNTGAVTGLLAVTVEFVDPLGVLRTVPVGSVTAGSAWMPSPVLLVPTNVLSLVGGRTVTFRFTPNGGAWGVDDVYVDPYGKG